MKMIILVGPTGTGKTATAIELCKTLGGEIVSADSMQIYKGCDIATAKATPAERRAARHHLIDICDPRETYSAARWAQDAQAAIDDIHTRGKVPIICGGTGFYINALLHPETLASVPPNPALRAELEAARELHGNQWLHARLQSLDAPAAARLHPNDFQRVMRAIEVAAESPEFQVEGSKFKQAHHSPLTTHQVIGLTLPREKLYARLEARVDAMMAAGALDELKNLLTSGVPRDAPALQGVGYRQLLPALEDESLLPAAIELWKRDTRRYAKRQMTWFRHQLPVQWLEADGATAQQLAQKIVQLLGTLNNAGTQSGYP
jgi:tRNA dimethylallyltransferase